MAEDYWGAVINGVNAIAANNAKSNATQASGNSTAKLNTFIDNWSKPSAGTVNTTFADFQPVTYVAGSRPAMGYSQAPSYLSPKPSTMRVADAASKASNMGDWEFVSGYTGLPEGMAGTADVRGVVNKNTGQYIENRGVASTDPRATTARRDFTQPIGPETAEQRLARMQAEQLQRQQDRENIRRGTVLQGTYIAPDAVGQVGWINEPLISAISDGGQYATAVGPMDHLFPGKGGKAPTGVPSAPPGGAYGGGTVGAPSSASPGWQPAPTAPTIKTTSGQTGSPVGVGGSLNPNAQGDFYNNAVDIKGYTTDGVGDRAAQVYSSLVGGVDRAAALAASQGFAQALRSGIADSSASASISDELTRKFSDVYAKLGEDARKAALGEAQSNYDSYLKGINQAVSQNNAIAGNNNAINSAIMNNDTSRMNAAQSVAAQLQGAQLSADTSRGNSILNALMTQAAADRVSLLNAQVANGSAINNLLANPAIRALGNTGANAIRELFTKNPTLTEEQAVAALEQSLGIDVGYGNAGYNDVPTPTTGSELDWNYDYYQPSLADATADSYWGW